MMSEQDDLTVLQVRKLRQEIEKLKVETKLLKRASWKQAPYLAATLPLIAVLITAMSGYLLARCSLLEKRDSLPYLLSRLSRLNKRS